MNQQQWQSHVRAYERSSQSKRAYTRKHNLNYSQFLYWYRKLTELTSVSDTPDFVPVDIKSPVATT
ncbi:IS66 family insertion sequence element accessory protein TnpA, partial [Microbulbifer epialgicus]